MDVWRHRGAGRNARTCTVAAGALVLLSSCATWSFAPRPGDVHLTSRLPAETTAWLIADALRHAFPSADPLPQERAAPVLALGDRYVVQVGRRAPDGYRLAMNGRLAGPDLRAPAPVVALDDVVFHAAAAETRSADHASDRATVFVSATDSGSRLAVRLVGDANRPEVIAQLATCIALGEAVADTAHALRVSDPATAAVLATAALAAHDRDTTGILARLSARLRVHLTVALVRTGELAPARLAAADALIDDSGCLAARVLKARLDATLARPVDLARGLRLLGHQAGPNGVLHEPLIRHEFSSATPPTPAQRRREAERWLAAGDAEAALRWALYAEQADPFGAAGLRLLARIHRSLDQRRKAYEVALREAAVHGYSPDLVLAMADDALALHEPAAAARLLTRHWREMDDRQLAQARRLLTRAGDLTGDDAVVRIALSENIDPSLLAGAVDPRALAHPWHTTVEIGKPSTFGRPADQVATPPR